MPGELARSAPFQDEEGRINKDGGGWRDAHRRGALVAEEAALVPLRIVPELPPPEPQGTSTASPPAADPGAEPDARIEIVLPDGTALRVPETIGTTALRRVLSALRMTVCPSPGRVARPTMRG